MIPYPKIDTMFKRTERGEMILGEWAQTWMSELAGIQWSFTEKVDGTNIRVGLEDGKVVLGGRTDRAQLPAKLVARLEELFPLTHMEDQFRGTEGVCLYGEGYGAGIQKGGVYRSDQDFILFDVWVDGVWLERANVEEVGVALGIDVVPIVGFGTLHDAQHRVSGGISMTSMVSTLANPITAEGLVCRPWVNLFDRMGRRVIVKLKGKDFARLAKGVMS